MFSNNHGVKLVINNIDPWKNLKDSFSEQNLNEFQEKTLETLALTEIS
jgi:hypothetical protein